jgi:uncharacterized membrane protein (Fun14 family)
MLTTKIFFLYKVILSVEDFLFSAGGGFLLGAVAGYAIKKVTKIAVVGLFVAGLTFLSYKTRELLLVG